VFGERLDVSVVLPCLNEEGSVGLCVNAAREALAAAGMSGEVVVVDNGSTDNSAEVAMTGGARVVEEDRPGYGSALLAGFGAARGEVVVMADADFTYDLGRISDLIGPIIEGRADLVLGSRLDSPTRGAMPFLHRFVGTSKGCDGQPIRFPRFPPRCPGSHGAHLHGHGAC
jgi:glycosyltransferase involved in cell wall biosynthesis